MTARRRIQETSTEEKSCPSNQNGVLEEESEESNIDENAERKQKPSNLEELRARHREEERAMVRKLAERKEKEVEENMEKELEDLVVEEQKRMMEVEKEGKEKLHKVNLDNKKRKSEIFRIEYIQRGQRLNGEKKELLEKLRITENHIDSLLRDWYRKDQEVEKENTHREKLVNTEIESMKQKQESRSKENIEKMKGHQKNKMNELRVKHKKEETAIEGTKKQINPGSANQALKEYIDKKIVIKKLELECPVCFEEASVPIMMCEALHLICSSCRLRLGRCPECRRGYGQEVRRHRFAEKTAQELEELRREMRELSVCPHSNEELDCEACCEYHYMHKDIMHTHCFHCEFILPLPRPTF